MQILTHKLGFSFSIPDTWELASSKIKDEFSPYVLYRFIDKDDNDLLVLFEGFIPLTILDEYYADAFRTVRRANDIINQEFIDFKIDGVDTQVMIVRSVNPRFNKFQIDYFFPISTKESSVGHICLMTQCIEPNADQNMKQILASWKY